MNDRTCQSIGCQCHRASGHSSSCCTGRRLRWLLYLTEDRWCPPKLGRLWNRAPHAEISAIKTEYEKTINNISRPVCLPAGSTPDGLSRGRYAGSDLGGLQLHGSADWRV